jgi:hypothetical protein
VLTGRNHDSNQTVAPTPTTESAAAAGGWQEVPPAPLLPRAEAQVLFVSAPPMFVVFAGTDQVPCPVCDVASYGNTLHDAAAYDLSTSAWRPIADLPKASSYIGSSAVVDGDVYWLSVRDPSTNESGIDATLQKWSTTDNTWTEVALPTEVPGNPKLLDMNGKLLLYPGTDEVGAFPDQLLDGTTWTSLPNDPLGFVSGRQFLMLDGTLTLFGTEVQRVMPSPTPTLVIGASYDADLGTWTRLPDSDQLTTPVVALGSTAYAPFGGDADGGEVNNWGRTVPNGGSYSAADGWLAFPPPVPDDLMGVVVPSDDVAVLGVKGHVLHAADGTYSAIPTLPDGLGDQFGQAVANGGGAVFTFGGGLNDANGGLGVHNRGFVWRPGVSVLGSQTTLEAVIRNLGIDPARAPDGALDLAGGTFCGDEIPDPVDGTISSNDGRACFAAALADGSTALYIMQLTTDEGDPIAYIWHTGPDGDHVYIDSTRDAFGSGEWSQQLCALAPLPGTPPFGCAGDRPATDINTFCDPAVKLLQAPDLSQASAAFLADLRAIDTSALSAEQRGIYLAAVTELESRVGSPDGFDTGGVVGAVNDVCGTDLPTSYVMP